MRVVIDTLGSHIISKSERFNIENWNFHKEKDMEGIIWDRLSAIWIKHFGFSKALMNIDTKGLINAIFKDTRSKLSKLLLHDMAEFNGVGKKK